MVNMKREQNLGSQNFVLFFETKNDDRCISGKILKLYMNRFVIDEIEQHEIIGVYSLKSVRPGYMNEKKLSNVMSRKLRYDKKILKNALRNSITKQMDEQLFKPFSIHFMIGTESINEKIKQWISKWLIKSLSKNFFVICTQLQAFQSFVAEDHNDRLWYDLKTPLGFKNDDLINDDSEYLADRLAWRIVPYGLLNQRVSLAFSRMLSDTELEKTVFFIRTIEAYDHPRGTHTSYIPCLSRNGPVLSYFGCDLHSKPMELVDSIRPGYGLNYLNCACTRYSFIL